MIETSVHGPEHFVRLAISSVIQTFFDYIAGITSFL